MQVYMQGLHVEKKIVPDMLSSGCVPIPRYVIQYNKCPSISIRQSNEALHVQPKLNYSSKIFGMPV